MNHNRDKLQIIRDICKSLKWDEGLLYTHIMYKVRLNSYQTTQYIDLLVKSKCLDIKKDNYSGKDYYYLNRKGLLVLKLIIELYQLLELKEEVLS